MALELKNNEIEERIIPNLFIILEKKSNFISLECLTRQRRKLV